MLNDIACFDHLPLCIDINCDINPLYDNNFSDKPSTSKWHIATDIDKQNYHKCTGEILNTIVLPTEALLCKDTNFESHYLDIEHFYDSIVSSIQIATSKCIPSSINGSKFKVIPGWNDYVKESYAISRDALKWWISNNRLRDGLIYHNMRISRAQFKYALRIAKRNEETARADALARDLYDKDLGEFWSSVRQLNRNSSLLSNCIDGVTGEKNISNYWKEHFYNLLNCNGNDTDIKHKVIGKLENIQYDANMIVTSEDICKLIEKLKCGKASGPDGISAESLMFAHDRLHVLLSLCFSACFSHSYLPKSLLKTTIVPVIKNKCGSLTDCNNYRPIAIATSTSKLLESIILLKCEESFFTSDNQFGFKAGHSTEFCIYSLLEFIDFYKKRNTTVFVTFLDASKVFDKVNYW